MPVLEDLTALVGGEFKQAEFDGDEQELRLIVGHKQIVITGVDIESDVSVVTAE